MKKFSAIFLATMLVFTMVACGEDDAVDEKLPTNQSGNNSENVNENNSENANENDNENANESNSENANKSDSENTNKSDSEGESGMDQQENNAQGVGDTGLEATADELFDLFINGSISAVSSTDFTSTFYITDLNMDSEEWDSYSVGERVDLDNDGEDELVISGPYGGIYLDARDNKVYEFAAGEGTALILSYTYYNGAVWIMYSNRSSAGFEFYHMEKFEGADNLVAEMNFGEELADPNNAESEMKYTLNGSEISYDEYTELCSKIFAAEVNTNFQSKVNNDGRVKKDDELENLPGEYASLTDDNAAMTQIASA